MLSSGTYANDDTAPSIDQTNNRSTDVANTCSLAGSITSTEQTIINSKDKFSRLIKMPACIPCIKSDPNRRESKMIDKQLSQWNREQSKIIQLLLIGAGESGKTTIIKQMKILHIKGFTEQERQDKVKEIRENVFEAIKELTSNMSYLKPPIKLHHPDNQQSLDFINKLDMTTVQNYDFPEDFYEHVSKLWNDPGIQLCYYRSNEFSLIDCAKYFLGKIDEIKDSNYLPTDQDILRCRKRTYEIQKIEFNVNVPKTYGGGYQSFWMFDVGGQRGERRKWIQVFDGITAVLFLVDSSGFDTNLREDGKMNRLKESLEIFENIWNSKYLSNAGIILFLNKQDILKEKIERGSKIENYFPEYNDYKLSSKETDSDDEYLRARSFIRDKFLDITKKKRTDQRRNTQTFYMPNEDYKIKRECFSHYTTATDTNNIKTVFKDVHTMILMNNLRSIV